MSKIKAYKTIIIKKQNEKFAFYKREADKKVKTGDLIIDGVDSFEFLERQGYKIELFLCTKNSLKYLLVKSELKIKNAQDIVFFSTTTYQVKKNNKWSVYFKKQLFVKNADEIVSFNKGLCVYKIGNKIITKDYQDKMCFGGDIDIESIKAFCIGHSC
jgi:hypothetical protein